MSIAIRPAIAADRAAIWSILEPVFRAGETYAVPQVITEADALDYWCAVGHEVFVATDGGQQILGTYFICPNQKGGGAHVANCGYITATEATGTGVARSMCEHSLEQARQRGFLAMQFNFVVSSNGRAVRLWQSFGFEVVGRLTEAFQHPRLGLVDALVMYRKL